MTLYYYTDPLAAAWMHKCYGMLFVSWHSGKEYDPTVIVSNAGSPIKSIRENQRYVIHPDSLHLLEPRTGDFVSGPYVLNGIVKRVNRRGEYTDVDVVIGFSERVPNDILGRCTFPTASRFGSLVIIQRGGQPFFWPNREDSASHLTNEAHP